MSGFECQTFGKWILSGEHTVLRGGEALVFPLRDKRMNFHYLPGDRDLQVEFSGERGQELALVFYGVLEEALKRLSKPRSSLNGQIKIASDLRLGAGMGTSAALCVGVAKWMQHMGWVSENELYEFSRSLEDLFHGESSGVDIAVALEGRPLRFKRGGDWKPLHLEWQPYWTLSYSGKRGSTAECVKKVKALGQSDLETANALDQKMNRATELAVRALSQTEEQGLPLLIESMNLGREVFEGWGLCKGALGDHMRELQKSSDVLALKPTGSGGGGYVIALHKQ